MIKQTISGHTIEFHDNISSLPVKQFHLYTKYCLVASGIGDNIDAIDSHISKIVSYIDKDPKRAKNELLNYRRCLFSIITEADYRHKANLCLVKSVDGKNWTDFTESGIDKLYEMVTTAEERALRVLENELKRKLDEELMTYFPELFASSVEKNQTDLLYRRALLQLAEITDGVDNTEAIRAINGQIYAMADTPNFEGNASAEIEIDKRFEEMCLVIAKEFGGKVKGYSVMEFYTANKILADRQKQLNKTRKK